MPNCNLGPSGGTNPTTASGSAALQTYVQSLGYPGIDPNRITVNATWLSADTATGTAPAYSTTVWDVVCTATDLNGGGCNTVGDAVNVTVSYQMVLPFWKNRPITVASTSQMVINE
jgi:hypothetical protein